MKDKLKKAWDHVWYIFLIYVLFMSSSVAVAVGIVIPKFGISVLVLSIGFYGLYLKYGKKE